MHNSVGLHRRVLASVATGALFCAPVAAQNASLPLLQPLPSASQKSTEMASQRFDVSSLPAGSFDAGARGQPEPSPSDSDRSHGLAIRAMERTLKDQEGIYKAPFKPSNFKWDALTLGGTAVFLATDRHIENNLPGGHYQLYQDTSNIAIGGLAAGMAGVWLYGIRTDHRHARETGWLELEALTNAFLVYTPMQFIAGRQRPGEGNGHGDFLKHHALNTAFPSGHSMFTWTMATVAAHEYSKPWIQVLAYGAAFAVTASRLLARDHWASDMWAGAALGIGIGAFTFHTHCDPDLSDSCKHHTRFIF